MKSKNKARVLSSLRPAHALQVKKKSSLASSVLACPRIDASGPYVHALKKVVG